MAESSGKPRRRIPAQTATDLWLRHRNWNKVAAAMGGDFKPNSIRQRVRKWQKHGQYKVQLDLEKDYGHLAKVD